VDQSRPLDQIDFDIIERSKSTLCIVIINKIDLPKVLDEEKLKYYTKDIPTIRISAKTGEGIDSLIRTIRDEILGSDSAIVYPSLAPNMRHKQSLEDAYRFFRKAISGIKKMAPVEIITEDLKSGLEALGEITGETGNDEIYDKIFSEFCLGK
jgi:tRNA modification GTPase